MTMSSDTPPKKIGSLRAIRGRRLKGKDAEQLRTVRKAEPKRTYRKPSGN